MDSLAAISDPAKRGRALERYLAHRFRQHHFTVIVNPRAARPRQTDLIAVKLDERYLIECKWRMNPATINDIDSLRSRLHRTSPGVVGVLVSMNGFTEEVKIDVRYQRQQPVLLLSGSELRDIEAGYLLSLPDLLYRKKESLLRDAVVLVDGPRKPARNTPRLPMPQPELRFAPLRGTERSLVLDCGGGFDPVTFTHSIHDIDWAQTDGAGVNLDVELDFADQTEVIRAFDVLADLGWVSEHGRWSIHQASRNWHGMGVASLTAEMPHWRERADHHTEEVCYVDRCDGGFYALAFDVDASPPRWVRYMNMSFQLEGLPLDPAPLLHLCRALGVHQGLHVRPRREQSLTCHHFRRANIDLTIRSYIVAEDRNDPEELGDWAVGVVVDNPFRRGGHTEIESPMDLAELSQSEFLLCDLRHHHPFAYPRDRYVLHAIEVVHAGRRAIVRPIADWPR